MKARHRRRFERQLAALSRTSPHLHTLLNSVQGGSGAVVRIPLGLVFIAGGLLAVLPVFGLWMIPVGFLLLAMDLPVLRPVVSAPIIRLRRKWALWRRRPRGSGMPPV